MQTSCFFSWLNDRNRRFLNWVGLIIGTFVLATVTLQAESWNRILPSAGKIGDEWGDIVDSFDVLPERPDEVRAIVKRTYFRNSEEGKILVQAIAIQFESASVATRRFEKMRNDSEHFRPCSDWPESLESIGLAYAERTVLFDRYWLRTQQSGLGQDYVPVLRRIWDNARTPLPLLSIPAPPGSP